MENSEKVYIGSYLVIETKLQIKDFVVYVCQCDKFRDTEPDGQFCGQCGGKFKKNTIKRNYQPKFYDLIDEESLYEDQLFPPFEIEKNAHQILLANENYRDNRSGLGCCSQDFNEIIPITSDDIKEDLLMFNKYFI